MLDTPSQPIEQSRTTGPMWAVFLGGYRWLWAAASLLALVIFAALVLVRPQLVLSYRADQLDTIVVDEQERGFYTNQTDDLGNTYRWTRPESYTLLDLYSRKPLTLLVETRSPAVSGGPDKPIIVFANGVEIGQLRPDPTKREFSILSLKFVPPYSDVSQLKISFQATGFKVAGDGRVLGFQLKRLTLDRSEAWSGIDGRMWLLYAVLPLAIAIIGLWRLSRLSAIAGYVAVGLCLVPVGLMLVTLAILSGIGLFDPNIYWLWVAGCAYLAIFFGAVGLALVPVGRADAPTLYQRFYVGGLPWVQRHPVIAAFIGITLANLVFSGLTYARVYFETGNIFWFARYWDGPEYVFIANGLYDPNDPLLKIPDFGRHSRLYWAAHFPGFAVLLKIFAPLFGYSYAPMVINFLLATGFACVLYLLLRDFGYSKSPLWLSIISLVLPLRWLIYHTVSASEPMMMFFTVLAVYLFKKERYVWAGLAGALAVFARPPGIFLYGGFLAAILWSAVYPVWQERRFDIGAVWKRLNWRAVLGVSLILVGLLAVFVIFAWRYGDFWAYFHIDEEVKHVRPFPLPQFGDYALGNSGLFYYYILEAVGLVLLWRQKRFDIFWIGLAVVGYTFFLAHPDILRYSLPAFPFVLLMPYADLLSSKVARWLFVPVLLAVYLYTWTFIPQGIADYNETWLPMLKIVP